MPACLFLQLQLSSNISFFAGFNMSAGTISDILSRRQVDLGAMRKQTPVPSAAQTNQLRSKIAAFFGLGGGKPRS